MVADRIGGNSHRFGFFSRVHLVQGRRRATFKDTGAMASIGGHGFIVLFSIKSFHRQEAATVGAVVLERHQSGAQTHFTSASPVLTERAPERPSSEPIPSVGSLWPAPNIYISLAAFYH